MPDILPPESQSRARPDFLCVGAQKAGTSWLNHQLRSHPDFWMPPLKELHYFDEMSHARAPHVSLWCKARVRDERDRAFLAAMTKLCSRQFIDICGYGQLFAAKGGLLSGEVGPVYSVVPEEIIEGIMEHFPELKVIFIARDPVERAWSALSMAVRYRGIAQFNVNKAEIVTQNLLHPHVLCRSFQSLAVARWRRHVPPQQFRVFFFDDLERDPVTLRCEIIGFLGGDPAKPRGPAEQKINQDRNKLPLPARIRDHLAHFFARELRRCAVELGGAAVQWPARYGYLFFLAALLISPE